MKQMLNRVEKGESEIKKIEEKWGISVQEARDLSEEVEDKECE